MARRNGTVLLITHEFPLEAINEAFETQLRRDEAVKIRVNL